MLLIFFAFSFYCILFYFVLAAKRSDSFFAEMLLLRILFGVLLRFCWGIFGVVFGVVFGDSFAYLFVAPEKWLPAPKAPEGKAVCKRKTEICSVNVKKIMRAGECGPVKPEGSTVASRRLCSPI